MVFVANTPSQSDKCLFMTLASGDLLLVDNDDRGRSSGTPAGLEQTRGARLTVISRQGFISDGYTTAAQREVTAAQALQQFPTARQARTLDRQQAGLIADLAFDYINTAQVMRNDNLDITLTEYRDEPCYIRDEDGDTIETLTERQWPVPHHYAGSGLPPQWLSGVEMWTVGYMPMWTEPTTEPDWAKTYTDALGAQY